ncbi:MAG: serine/threonine protein kinase, partial [Planctomycetes bacterium]|nr:serine/threonine protein kinase [Planctomycetota bacterium]
MTPAPAQSGYEDLLVAVFAARDRGDLAECERLVAAHPEHTAALRAALETMARAGFLDDAAAASGFPPLLGEFRLLQPIGGGGMGIVFLAEQPSLRRKVAVKLVRPELMLSGVARERFQREVETIAQLQHPGIVPVLAVGRHHGVPWFAMEFVPGCSLAEVLLSVAGRSTDSLDGDDFARAVGAGTGGDAVWCADGWWRTCVGVVAAIASTTAFVHARGILHRDLKPSNIMVTTEGHPLLLDFGLARVGAAADTPRLTRSGVELGSLAYMSPEQLRGEAVDERTDVYSLGVTLYELLALALPFAAVGDAELRLAIELGRHRPLRTQNRAVSPDLGLVVATAIDIDRERRYPSMAAMAADLRAVLEG